MKKLINLSNHPYSQWSEKQKEYAKVYGECIDFPFPNVDPKVDSSEIEKLAEDYLSMILGFDGELTVHIMGELTFCFALVAKLQKHGIICIASSTLRDAEILPDGSKQVRFHFSRFRNYPLLSKFN